MRHLDLFSGHGGFALAVMMLGHETIAFCDNEPAAQEILALRWPGVPIHDDIRTLKGNQFGPVDLVTGGFPCQPFSVAGKQRGKEDDRHLWPEMLRVIEEARPRYVLGENVSGIIKMELDTCLSDLETLGYSAWAIVVPAISTDARHIRKRVWLMAHDDRHRLHDERDGQEGAEGPARGATQPPGELRSDTPQQLAGYGIPTRRCNASSVAYPNGQRPQTPEQEPAEEWTEDSPSIGALFTNNGVAGGTSGPVMADTDSTRLERQCKSIGVQQEHPIDSIYCRWPTEPGVGRMAHGVSRRVDRLRLLGNSIVPAVAYEILRVMIGEAT